MGYSLNFIFYLLFIILASFQSFADDLESSNSKKPIYIPIYINDREGDIIKTFLDTNDIENSLVEKAVIINIINGLLDKERIDKLQNLDKQEYIRCCHNYLYQMVRYHKDYMSLE